MASAREMRLRIRSVKNISQVTRALEAVTASKVRKAVAAVAATRAYATKAWQVLTHIAAQPGRENLHPLLTRRPQVRKRAGGRDQRRPRPGRGVQHQYHPLRQPSTSISPKSRCVTLRSGARGGICSCAGASR